MTVNYRLVFGGIVCVCIGIYVTLARQKIANIHLEQLRGLFHVKEGPIRALLILWPLTGIFLIFVGVVLIYFGLAGYQ